MAPAREEYEPIGYWQLFHKERTLPYKVELRFERTALVTERGGASVVVDDPTDIKEITAKLQVGDFKEFLITERDYSQMQWKWSSPIKEVEDAVVSSPTDVDTDTVSPTDTDETNQ